VPTELLAKGTSLLQSQPMYELCAPRPPQIGRLYHMFPLFKYKGLIQWIQLVPSQDCHFTCTPSNFEKSDKGLPYVRLDVFAQSLLDTNDWIDLVDLVDGMDLSLEWGIENLQLDGTNDVSWAERKNETIKASVPLTDTSCLLEMPTGPFSRREYWEQIVGSKMDRIGSELPKEFYATRFRPKGSKDPRLPRDEVYPAFLFPSSSNSEVVVVNQ